MEPEIRLYYKGFYKVYTEDYEVMKKIASWHDCKRSVIYSDRSGNVFGWDLIFPSHLYNRVAGLAGLPLRKKNPNRQKRGQEMADENRQHQFKG